MTPHSFHAVQASVQVLPVALVFSRQLLLKSSNKDNNAAPKDKPVSLDARASHVTMVLKSIQGYHHGGLNE
jgi:hypothetical protein